jgi:hypothetical protein
MMIRAAILINRTVISTFYRRTGHRYPDQDLIRYAEIDQIKEDAERLRQMHVRLEVVLDALNDQELNRREKAAHRIKKGPNSKPLKER